MLLWLIFTYETMNSFKFRHFGIPSSIEEATSISTLNTQALKDFSSHCRLIYAHLSLILLFISLIHCYYIWPYVMNSLSLNLPSLSDAVYDASLFSITAVSSIIFGLATLKSFLTAFKKKDRLLSSIRSTTFSIPYECSIRDDDNCNCTACEAALSLIEYHSLSDFKNNIISQPREFTLFDLECLYYIHQFMPTPDELRLKSACKKLHLQN